METGQIPGIIYQKAMLDGQETIETSPFELYFALQEFSNLKHHLSVMPQPPEKPLGIQNYHLWFESIIQLWIRCRYLCFEFLYNYILMKFIFFNV
jgi:BAI1-associated protein 3